MTAELRSRVLGLILGRLSRGGFPQREPVAWLYGHVAKDGESPTHNINGVDYVGWIGPKLPEVEGTGNAVISEWNDVITLHLVSSADLVYDGSSVFATNAAGGKYANYMYTVSAWGYVYGGNIASQRWEVGSNNTIWSNRNIYNEDGTIYLAASEPVPVYE